MFSASDVTVIDIGSQRISAYSAERLSDDNFTVKSSCWTDYSGYMDGEWLEQEELIPSINKLLDRIERTSGRIKTLYVGIPADFCLVRTVYKKMVFPKARRVMNADIEELLNENDPFSSSEYTRIYAGAVYYINDNGERIHSPVGTVTSYLKAQLSYIGADGELLSFLRKGILRRGIRSVHFIQSEFSAAMALFGTEERDAGIILADIGYLSTSVLYVGGDAPLEMKTFSLGGSMIPVGLSNSLDIPFPVASAFSSKINLGYKDEGEYSLKYDTSSYSFQVEQINEIAKECVRCVVNYIQKAIDSFRFETSPHATIYLTGGGFSELRCSREYIAKCFGRNVESVQPAMPNFDKPYYSTAVGLLKRGFMIEKQDRYGFFKKLFRL